jgi:methionine-rich copper-binding protein CopC
MPTKLQPGDDAVVTTAPTEVSLDTGEAMQDKPGANDLIVDDANGKTVTTTAASVDATRKHMSVPLPKSLAVGRYGIRWFTVSADDGEADSGAWHFTYDPAQQPKVGGQPKADSGGSTQYLVGGVVVLVVLLGAGVVLVRRRRA